MLDLGLRKFSLLFTKNKYVFHISEIRYPKSAIVLGLSVRATCFSTLCLCSCSLTTYFNTFAKNASTSSAEGCYRGCTIRNPTKGASAFHHLLFGTCGSRRFQIGSDFRRLALRNSFCFIFIVASSHSTWIAF
jgi:hypothetical protein